MTSKALRKRPDRTLHNAEDHLDRRIDLSVAPANPAELLLRDYRRTAARIEYLEGRVARLSEEEMLWGKTKEEQVNATEFPGTNVTHEARRHLFLEMLEREQKHLLEVTKLMASNKFKAAAMAFREESEGYLYNRVLDVVRALGHNPNDPAVRDTLIGVFTPQAARAESEDEEASS